MTDLDWLLSDEERSKGALSDLDHFIEQYNINDWWCEHKCPSTIYVKPIWNFLIFGRVYMNTVRTKSKR